MEFKLSHRVVYETPRMVPVLDVIESLRGAERITQDIGPLMEAFCPGLEIQGITLHVREISQNSPLTDSFMFAVLASFQENLTADVHYTLEELFGVHINSHYENIISVIFLVLLFYGGRFAYEQANKRAERTKVKRQLAGLISDVSALLKRDEAEIRRILDDRYSKGKLKGLIQATHRFLTPSKNQGNAPLRINQVQIPREVVADFPSDAQFKSEEPAPYSEPLENVDIELHAQDLDHGKQGWAAVIPSLSKSRIKMQLYPPINPTDIYTRERIRGDVLVESRVDSKGDIQPVRVHLIRLRD